MNRTQRRAQMRAEKRRNRMAQQVQEMQVRINYGHNDTHVLMRFSKPVDLSVMTIEQAEAMRTELGRAIEALREHHGKKPANG